MKIFEIHTYFKQALKGNAFLPMNDLFENRNTSVEKRTNITENTITEVDFKMKETYSPES